jgi:uncharacterized protein (DUF1800 family)
MQFVRDALALFLCAALTFQSPSMLANEPAPAQPKARPERSAYSSTQLHGDARILQALNRFTFGPEPGELEGIRAEGLDKWFNEQLHPKSIDESKLYTRLAQFPAMQMSLPDLTSRYPSNALLRMAMKGMVQIPSDPIERAIYVNQIYRIHLRQQGRAKKARNGGEATPAANPNQNDQPIMPRGPLAQAEQMDATDGADAQAPTVGEAKIDDLLSLPPDQRVTRLASIREPEFDAFIKSLKPFQRAALVAGMTPLQKETVLALIGPERMVVQELEAERLLCDIYSNAQLLEVMTDFWLNHFSIYLRKNQQMPYHLVSYERDSIRPYALGRFGDLLDSVAHSPAMLTYLDNAESVGPHSLAAERYQMTAWRRPNRKRKDAPGINENYGRELMELHTVGVNGGYTQADVIQASKVLTGWTVERPQLGGGFVFNPNRHEPGTKTVMGFKIKQNGEKEGEELLHMLATRPATAQMISRELAVRFVSDHPPQSLVDRLARTYLSTDGNISAVLETLFHSPEFWSGTDYRAKVKTPLEYVVSAVRSSSADVENYKPLINALRVMGMPLYGCVQPNGYAWTADAWVNTGDLVDRMNFALELAGDRLPGIKMDWAAQPRQTNAADPDAIPAAAIEEAWIEPMLLPGGASSSTRAAALQEFEKQNTRNGAQMRPVIAAQRINRRPPPNMREREDALLAGLLIGSPDFQRR